MTPPLSATAEIVLPHRSEMAAVIASLPDALLWHDDTADLVAVSGDTGWPERVRAHINAGARGILLVDPVAISVEEFDAIEAHRDVVVVIEWPFVADAALSLVAAPSDVRMPPGDLIECRMVVPVHTRLERTLVGHLAFTRGALGAGIASARALEWSEHGYTVLARMADGRRCLLTAAATGTQPPHASVRFVAERGEIEFTVPDADVERAARLSVSSSHGVALVPIVHERAHRAPWRRLHSLVLRGSASSDLREFGVNSLLAGSITGSG